MNAARVSKSCPGPLLQACRSWSGYSFLLSYLTFLVLYAHANLVNAHNPCAMPAPTHHLTLTRTAAEIAELHRKLASAHPDVTLPELPLQAQENMFEPVSVDKKRKSSFLHTLSRLASPGPNRRERSRDWRVPSSGMRTSCR